MHRFGNFRREDDGRIPTVRESLRESINLPFVRLMRDWSYSTYETINSAELLRDDKDPRRQEYLTRFADREGLGVSAAVLEEIPQQERRRAYRDLPSGHAPDARTRLPCIAT